MHADALHLLALADPPPVPEELGSLLMAIQMDVHWLDKRLAEQPGRDPAAAQAIRCKCRNLSRLIERAVDSLGCVGRVGLWDAMEGQAREFAEIAELELEWDMQPGELPQLPEPAAMAVFRMFHEMLSNVRRHAQASRIAVRIATDSERLRITVEDNGNGASPEAFEAPAACGVRSMRERARQLRGHIAISSEVGHGCAFTLVLPLK